MRVLSPAGSPAKRDQSPARTGSLERLTLQNGTHCDIVYALFVPCSGL